MTSSSFKTSDIIYFQSQVIRTFEYNNEIWYIAKEISKAIATYRNPTSLQKLIIPTLGSKHIQKQFLKDSMGRLQPYVVISTTALEYYLQRSRKVEAKLFAQQLGLNLNIIQSPIEGSSIRLIKSTFQHLNPIEQFYVSGFCIDLYFPNQQLAIECMEDYHKYSILKDQKREKEITKLLNCHWIYYYPQESNFNIGETLNEIIQHIYEN